MAKLTKTQTKVLDLEKQIKAQGVRVAYERLRFSGLVLKSGLCWFKGSYYLFVDRYKSPQERRELLETALEEIISLNQQGADQPEQPPVPEPSAA